MTNEETQQSLEEIKNLRLAGGLGLGKYYPSATIWDAQDILGAMIVLKNLRERHSSQNFKANPKKILENSKETFGIEEQPLEDGENRIYAMVGNYPKYTGNDPMGEILYYNDKRHFNSNSVKGIKHYSFITDVLRISHAEEEQWGRVSRRIMKREELENLMIKSFEEIKYTDRFILSDIRAAFLELQHTPYTDRAVLGSSVQQKPYESKELTEQEWESYKEKYLNPSNKTKETK